MIKTRNFYSWHTLDWRCVWHISVCLLSLQDLTRSIQTNQVVNKFNRFPFTVLVSPVNNHIKWLRNIELPPLFLNSYWRLKILLPSYIDPPPPTRFSFSNGRGGGGSKYYGNEPLNLLLLKNPIGDGILIIMTAKCWHPNRL